MMVIKQESHPAFMPGNATTVKQTDPNHTLTVIHS